MLFSVLVLTLLQHIPVGYYIIAFAAVDMSQQCVATTGCLLHSDSIVKLQYNVFATAPLCVAC